MNTVLGLVLTLYCAGITMTNVSDSFVRNGVWSRGAKCFVSVYYNIQHCWQAKTLIYTHSIFSVSCMQPLLVRNLKDSISSRPGIPRHSSHSAIRPHHVRLISRSRSSENALSARAARMMTLCYNIYIDVVTS